MSAPAVGDRIMLVLARADHPVVLTRIISIIPERSIETEYGFIPRVLEGVSWQRAEYLDVDSADALKAATLLASSAAR
jgi:hypothetical protein